MSTGGPSCYNNSAGRLFELLTRARQYPDGDQALFAWAAIFQIADKNDSTSVYRYLGELNRALTELEDEVRERLPAKANLLLKDFPSIRQAIAPLMLSTNWGQYKQHLGEHVMRNLEHCAFDLPKDADVTPDEIKQVQDAITSLFDQVRKSGIKNPLKSWLLERLAAIKQMIDLYWIKGPKVIREALVALAGEAAAYGQKFEEVKNEDATIFGRLLDTLNKLASIAEKIEKFRPLLEYTTGPASEMFGRLLLQGPG